jgi:hypothetical protein
MYRTGKYTKQTRELGQALRKLARDIDVKTATLMAADGGRPLKAIRRKAHVRRAMAAAKKAKEKTE